VSRPRSPRSLAPLCLLSLAACADGGATPACDDGSCDALTDLELPDAQVPASPCDGTIVDRSGRAPARVRDGETVRVGGKPVSTLLRDVVAVTSARRDAARALPIMEFAETMPDDALPAAPGARLDPTTCALVQAFVSRVP
jgi:hypothetical protein